MAYIQVFFRILQMIGIILNKKIVSIVSYSICTLCLVIMFFAIYLPVIRHEEDFLRQRFSEFDEYARRVPRLLPKLVSSNAANNISSGFSLELYLKHREYNALVGALAMMAALAMKIALMRTGLR